MSIRLATKVALVTGAASGIGRATALRFLREGATVFLSDVDEEGVFDVAKSANTARAIAVPADITDEVQLVDVFDHIARSQLVPDVVVANAGIQLFGSDARIHDLDAAVWRRTIDVNLTGTFLTVKHAVRSMLGEGGSIIVVGSPTGVSGEGRGFTAYSASKAGIHGLSRTVAADYADRGIRVNTVVPGFTMTPLTSSLSNDAGARASVVSRVPLQRPAVAEDLEGIMVFLASDESSYATGSMFFVDGGMSSL